MRKKVLTALLVVALMGGSVVAGAAGNSLLGAKVQGLFSVEVNGKTVGDAVVINGSTYAPVRSLTESLGADISVTGKKVVVTTDEDKAIQTSGKIYELTTQIESKNKQLGYSREYLKEKKDLFDRNASDEMYGKLGLKFEESDLYRSLTEDINKYQSEIDQLTKEISDLEAQKAALEK
ncbi:hypothetical protein D3C74_172330 [compost metagenome]